MNLATAKDCGSMITWKVDLYKYTRVIPDIRNMNNILIMGIRFINALVEKHKVLHSNTCSKLCVNHKSINLIFNKNPSRIQQQL